MSWLTSIDCSAARQAAAKPTAPSSSVVAVVVRGASIQKTFLSDKFPAASHTHGSTTRPAHRPKVHNPHCVTVLTHTRYRHIVRVLLSCATWRRCTVELLAHTAALLALAAVVLVLAKFRFGLVLHINRVHQAPHRVKRSAGVFAHGARGLLACLLAQVPDPFALFLACLLTSIHISLARLLARFEGL